MAGRADGSATAYRRLVASALAGFVLNEGKNLVKRVMGRKTYRSRLHRLVARHWPHFLRLRPITRLTSTDVLKGEGAGSRALMTVYTMAYCRAHGIAYRHTPFRTLAHADLPQEEWDALWERFFNLGPGEVPATGDEAACFDLFELALVNNSHCVDLVPFIQPAVPEPRPLHYVDISLMEDEAEREHHKQRFAALVQPLLGDLKARYRSNKAPRLAAPFTVAVHIRRGDVLPDRTDMWTGMDGFCRTLDLVTGLLREHGVPSRLQVFSQGAPEDFEELARFGPELHLDADAFWTMQQMIDSDLLVMSKSCFSYLAAMLSDGVALFESCDLPALEGRIMRDEAGGFDRAELRRRLAGVPSARPRL